MSSAPANGSSIWAVLGGDDADRRECAARTTSSSSRKACPTTKGNEANKVALGDRVEELCVDVRNNHDNLAMSIHLQGRETDGVGCARPRQSFHNGRERPTMRQGSSRGVA